MISITRKIVFHAGHMLKDDDSKCHNPHGHEYVLECTVEGDIQGAGKEAGMIMHFGGLKQIMMEEVHDYLDHKFIVEDDDPRCLPFNEVFNWEGVITTAYPPTAENLLEDMRGSISNKLPKGVFILKMRLQETINCWAEYEKE